MKPEKCFKALAVMLCLLMNVYGMRAQSVINFPNFDFETPLTGAPDNCNAGTSWDVAPNPYTPEYTGVPGNQWIDLTPCSTGFGINSWIQGTVATYPGQWYNVQLDLGCFTGWRSFDAGVDIYVNGVMINGGSNRLVNANFFQATNPYWQTLYSCAFQASSATTVVRIVEDGQNPLNPSYPQSPDGPGIIGIDNVKLVNLGFAVITNSPGSKCNEMCFSLISSIDNGTITGVNWYMNNNPISNNLSFCTILPRNVSENIKATYTISDACGSHTETVSLPFPAIMTNDCPCDIAGNMTLTTNHVSCGNYVFSVMLTPGYAIKYCEWSVDETPMTGTLNSAVLAGLSPGQHTICATVMGGVDGETGNLCCAKSCTVISVDPVSISPTALTETHTVMYCPLANPSGPLFNPCGNCTGDYYEFYRDGSFIANSSSPCTSYSLNNTAELFCYQTLLGGARCLLKTTLFEMDPQMVSRSGLPDVTYHLCGQIVASVPYPVTCGSNYPNYQVTGTGGFFAQGVSPGIVSLSPGEYVASCINYSTCSSVETRVHVLWQQQPTTTFCTALIEDCSLLNDPVKNMVPKTDCGDCKTTIANAGLAGPWKVTFYDPSSGSNVRVYTREYDDQANCKRCIVTYSVLDAVVGNNFYASYTLQTEQCITLYNKDLPECMQNKPLHVFPVGHAETTSSVNGEQGIQLCCNGDGEQYFLYSEDDPCCYQIISVDCLTGEGHTGGGGGGGDRTLSPGSTGGTNPETNTGSLKLKIVPNPTSAVFQIIPDEGTMDYAKVEIVDVNGRTVLVKNDINSKTIIDAARLSKGSYSVKVSAKSGIITLKLILMD